MKILPIIGTKIKPANVFRRLSQRLRFTESCDTFELSQDTKPFEALTLLTFEKLLNIKYKPEKLEGYFSTFVINKKTGKPVTVFVKQTLEEDRGYEQYYFYLKNKRTKELERLGHRDFYVQGSDDEIYPCYMISSKREDYLGVGIREHQITVERMKQVGAPNIMINPTEVALPFHEKCGFEWKKDRATRMHLSEKALEEWDIFINSGQRIIK